MPSLQGKFLGMPGDRRRIDLRGRQPAAGDGMVFCVKLNADIGSARGTSLQAAWSRSLRTGQAPCRPAGRTSR